MQIVIANRDIDRLSSNLITVKYVSQRLPFSQHIQPCLSKDFILSTNQLHDLRVCFSESNDTQVVFLIYRAWWSPVLLTAALGSATSYLRHVMRNNSLTNARRNISQHYDLVLFLHFFYKTIPKRHYV